MLPFIDVELVFLWGHHVAARILARQHRVVCRGRKEGEAREGGDGGDEPSSQTLPPQIDHCE